ncbi:FAD-binding monooxygenase, partial [Nocardia sp. NPDC059177]
SWGSRLPAWAPPWPLGGANPGRGDTPPPPGDLAGAQQRYQDAITPFTDKAKEIPGGSIKIMLPNTRIMAALAKVNVRVMMSRPLRPLTKKIYFGQTAEFALPTY